MSEPLQVLVTGSQGFVGSALCERLAVNPSIRLSTVSRRPVAATNARHYQLELTADSDLLPLLRGVDVVVHTAARVHMMQDLAADPLTEFRRVNTAATLHLARQAATAGVSRLIYLSSVKAMGEQHPAGQPFEVSQQASPADPYGQSKFEAEQGLWQIAAQTGLEVVVIRPPLVYGPGVKANFRQLIRLMQLQLPLPLAAVRNQRSLVALPNLVDLILCCLQAPAAANQTFLVSDNQDLSTPELMRLIADALGKKSLLFPLPLSVLQLAGMLCGKSAQVSRLCDSLQLDIRHTRQTLNWQPPVSAADGIRQTVQAYLAEQEHHD